MPRITDEEREKFIRIKNNTVFSILAFLETKELNFFVYNSIRSCVRYTCTQMLNRILKELDSEPARMDRAEYDDRAADPTVAG